MEELVELRGVEPQQRFLFRDQLLAHHVDRDLHRGGGGAFAVAGLQHVEAAGFHRELDVLHVLVVMLELGGDVAQLLVDFRHRVLERLVAGAERGGAFARDRRRSADARDHVFALRVDQVFAVEDRLPVRRVAREGNAGRRCLAEIAEHHGLHVDGSAPVFRNVVELAVDDGAVAHPAVEDGRDGAPELLARIFRERTAEFLLHRRLVAHDHLFPVVGRQVGVEIEAFALLVVVQDMLELVMAEAEDDVRIHLDEAAIAVIGEAVSGEARKAFGDGFVEAEVQHGVHHARHRGARARAHGDEQRVGRIAEALAGLALEAFEGGVHFGFEAGRVSASGLVIGDADGGGDGEARRHRQAELRHFGEVGALAAQQVLHRGIAVRGAASEGIDPGLLCALACRFSHAKSPSV